MANKYTGEVSLELGGKPHKIVFDWAALAAAKSKFSTDEISKLLKTQEPEKIAELLACGLQKNHPDMTADKIMKLSPPFIPVVKALDDALTFAYFGPGTLGDDDADKEASGAGDSKKKQTSKKATK